MSGDGSDLRGFYGALAAVAVVGGGALVWGVRSGGGNPPTEMDLEIPVQPAALVELARGVSFGDDEAPVTILVFSDYRCPACAAFAGSVAPGLREGVVRRGVARLVFHDFPLTEIHPTAEIAARAARCAADQGMFWEYHDRLFEHQGRWGSRPDPRSALKAEAGDLGLDRGDFEDCLDGGRHLDVVRANRRLGDLLGVNATPTVIVSAGRDRTLRLGSFDLASVEAAVAAVQADGG